MKIASSGRDFYDDGYSDEEDDEKQGLDNALSFPKNKLYGRAKQLGKLREVYDSLGAVMNGDQPKGPPFVVITGYPGSGKSSLIQNFARGLKKDVENETAIPFFFVRGKYDQRQDHPFSAIVQAFDALFFQIIRDDDPNEVQGIRMSIQSVIGEELHALTTLIPGLAAFMQHDGLNPQDTDIGARDYSWNQVKYLFQSLLRAISSPATGRRIILFLDNLDLADESSLDLLSIFLRDRSLPRIMIVCSLQSMPGSHHAAKDLLVEMEKEKSITKLDVGNLPLKDLNEFVGDSLEMEPDKTLPLSKIIFNQTKGNIFFAMNFMKEMHRKNVLFFSVIAFCWEWNMEAAGELEAELPNDILDVIVRTIEEMPERLQRALMIASYTRSILASSTLQSLMQSDDETLTKEEYDEVMELAMKEGYFVRCRTKNGEDIFYRFAHGQIQQAAMTLIEHGSERDKMKSFIALHLKELWNHQEDNWMLYIAADYLNSISSEEPQNECLARLNLTCGEKALEIGAFKPASFYLRKGLRALGKTDKPWGSHYELTINLLRMNAKAELFLGNFELSSSLSLQILKHCRVLEDKKPTYLNMAFAKAEQGRFEECMDIMLRALRVFAQFPKHLLLLHVQSDIRRVKRYFNVHADDFFLQLSDMEDPNVKSNMELLQVTAHRAFFMGNMAVFLLCSLRMIRLSIQHGIDGRTASGIAGYAIHLSVKGDQIGAVRFGRLVRQLLERGGGPRKSGARATYIVTMWVEVWTNPIESVLNSLHKGHKLGMEAGDLEISMLIRMSLFRLVFHGGYPLDAVKKLGEEIIHEMELSKYELFLHLMNYTKLPVDCLFRPGNTLDWEALTIQDFDETKKDNLMLILYWILPRIKIAIFFGNLDFAKELADRLALQRDDSVHMTWINRIVFSSLAYSRSARRTKNQRKRNIARARKNAGRLRKSIHSKGTTPLFLLKLLDADVFACTSNNHNDIQGHYDDAIASALDTGHIQFAALGSELAGEFFYNAAKEGLAEKYINDACALYKEWRAFAKVAHLAETYPSILSPEKQKSAELSNLLGEVGMYRKRKSADLDRFSTSIQTDVPFITPQLISPDTSFRD